MAGRQEESNEAWRAQTRTGNFADIRHVPHGLRSCDIAF
jgi:hypothetical protein